MNNRLSAILMTVAAAIIVIIFFIFSTLPYFIVNSYAKRNIEKKIEKLELKLEMVEKQLYESQNSHK